MKRRYRVPSADPGQPYYIYYPSGLELDRPWPEVSFGADGVVTTTQGRNPVTVAQYALYSHERSLRNVPGSEQAFVLQIRYLRDVQREDGAYTYASAAPEYLAPPGYLSAMAQGVAASALVRGYTSTGDTAYRDAAVNALKPLKLDVAGGGAAFLRDGSVFFEEVASAQPCHILNGHLFAAFGLWDVLRLGLGDAELRALHERSIETLLQWLPLYDASGWSYYQLAVRDANTRHLAHMSYHQLHIAQLRVYAAMTGHDAFASTANRWEAALGDLRARARVWLDSAAWLVETTRAHSGLSRRGPWRPIPVVTSQTAIERR